MSWTTIYEALPAGVGVKSKFWFEIPEDPTVWQTIFCKDEVYKPQLSFLVNATTADITKDLGLKYVEANPSTKVISTGIRHISDAKDFISGCPSWVSRSSSVPAWKNGPDGYGLSTDLVLDTADYFAAELKSDLQQGEFWYAGAKKQSKETLQLEHYFECRFAGPLIAAVTENYTKTDPTTSEALVLLDRIVNNVANLTWAPESLNAFKNNYFGGAKYHPDDKLYLAFASYMDQKAFDFAGLIIKISSLCFPKDKNPVYPPNSTMAKMLKILWDSPFCQGLWRTLPAASGAVCWSNYGLHPMNVVISKSPAWAFK